MFTAPLLRIALCLSLVAVAGYFLQVRLTLAFLANPVINSVILGAFILGIGQIVFSVLTLKRDIAWIREFSRLQQDLGTATHAVNPSMLSGVAAILQRKLKKGGGTLYLSPETMRSLLDGVQTRLEERREVTRYFIGLLVFLGLLGTFWGLLDTVSGIGSVIAGVAVETDNVSATFETLKTSLQKPLNGMGAAFGSSLLGLAGSLILGFLGLQAVQAGNRFYAHFEEWLSNHTHIRDLHAPDGAHASGFLEAFVPELVDEIRALRSALSDQDSHRQLAQALELVSHKLETLTQNGAASTEQLVQKQERNTDLLVKELRVLARTIGGTQSLNADHKGDHKGPPDL